MGWDQFVAMLMEGAPPQLPTHEDARWERVKRRWGAKAYGRWITCGGCMLCQGHLCPPVWIPFSEYKGIFK